MDTYEETICGRVKVFQTYAAWARRQRSGGRSDAREIYDAVHAKSVERYKVRYHCNSTPFKSVAEFDKTIGDNDTMIRAMNIPANVAVADVPSETIVDEASSVVEKGKMGGLAMLIGAFVVLWYLLFCNIRRN